MKNLLLAAVASFCMFTFVGAQNLVPDSSFELYSTCPSTDGQIDFATGWSDPTGTAPDYFNSCADVSTGYSVPANDLGTMTAHTGNAYAGLFTYFSLTFYSSVREYI